MTKVYLRVTAELPEGVSKTRFAEYVREAVGVWCKSLEPPHEGNGFEGDPLFELKQRDIKVSFSTP